MSARPFNEKDLITATNGDPLFLGVLVSTGAAVDNSTTATPFSTLAGKTLLLQTTAAGSIRTSAAPLSASGTTILALQSVVPPVVGTEPGPVLISGERVELIMLPLNGWLQWLPTSGAGNLFVWELR